ncbi:MAG TPA: hypothetical protein VI981_03635 [Candidatus Paceibacterota bacterium]
MEYSQETINEKIASLPSDVKDAINSVDIGMRVQTIGSKYHLQIDELNELEKTTAYVMLGLCHPSSYIEVLKTKLAISNETAEAIALDINETIFKPLRASLRKMHSLSEQEEILSAAPQKADATAPKVQSFMGPYSSSTPAAPLNPPATPQKTTDTPIPASKPEVMPPTPNMPKYADPYREPV